jgi:hypothetical protein
MTRLILISTGFFVTVGLSQPVPQAPRWKTFESKSYTIRYPNSWHILRGEGFDILNLSPAEREHGVILKEKRWRTHSATQ